MFWPQPNQIKAKAPLEAFLHTELEYRMELTTSESRLIKNRDIFQKDLEKNKVKNRCIVKFISIFINI